MQRLREIAPGVLVATAERGTTTSTVVVGDDGGCFATHPHWDHVLWSRDLGDVPRYAAPAAVRLVEQDRDEIVSYVRDCGAMARRDGGLTDQSWTAGGPV